MTQLDAYESALMLVRLAKSELRDKADLRAQLALIRLRAAEDVLRGRVDMHEFERKILGQPAQETFAGPPPTEDGRPADPNCVKCAGKGWLWGRELDDADPPTMEDTMTQYSCDSTGCRDARLAANR